MREPEHEIGKGCFSHVFFISILHGVLTAEVGGAGRQKKRIAMDRLDENFPYPNDLLFMTEPKKDVPSEYLYIHWDKMEEASFVAYFESLQSDKYVISQLNKIVDLSNNLEATDMEGLVDIIESGVRGTCNAGKRWKRMKAIKTIMLGSWNQLFIKKRLELLNK